MSASTAEHTIEDQLVAAIDPWLQHMHWRSNFDEWRERRINQERYQDARITQLEAIVGPIDQQVLLDVGAGMGGFAVAAALRGAIVGVCEYNPAYCRIVKLRAQRHHLTLPVYNAAGEALPFADHSFDTIVSWDVIEHVQSPDQILGEFNRVLVPGGVAIVTAINRWAWNDPHYHIHGLNYLPRPVAEHLIERRGRSKENAAFKDMQRLSEMHYFSYRSFVRLARQHGFSVIDLKERELRSGSLHSPKRSRRAVRAVLRALGLERIAYRAQRQWYVGMFELALVKDR